MRAVSSPKSQILALSCHAATPTEVVRKLEVHIAFRASGALDLRYVLAAQMDRVRVSPPRAAARRDELWKHTCFEAFFAEHGNGAYRELNFAPSSEWAMYSFDGYRQGMAAPETPAPNIRVERDAQQLTLEASVQPGFAAVNRLALAAVIEDENGRLSYWALRHPPGKPDFHHPGSFQTLP